MIQFGFGSTTLPDQINGYSESQRRKAYENHCNGTGTGTGMVPLRCRRAVQRVETLRFKVFNKLIKKLCQVYLDLFQWCQHKNATCFLLSR